MSLFDKTITLTRGTYTKDATGGPVEGTFATVTTSPGSIWPASASTVNDFSQRNLLVSHQVATTANIGSKSGDVITCGGISYTVVGYEPFTNSKISFQAVYITNVNRRNQP